MEKVFGIIAAFLVILFSPAYASCGYPNLLDNSNFEIWTEGTTIVPDGWRVGGNEYFLRESTIKYIGNYSCRFTNVLPGWIGEIYQNINLADPNWVHGYAWDIGYWKGKTVTFSAWVYADTPERVRLILNDDITQSFSNYHLGDSKWQRLVVTKTMSENALAFQVAIFITAGSAIYAYIDGAMLTENSDSPPFSERPLINGVNLPNDAARRVPVIFN